MVQKKLWKTEAREAQQKHRVPCYGPKNYTKDQGDCLALHMMPHKS